jgi:hypothetical protein
LDAVSKPPIPWKKISKITFWLWGFPPAGLYMLWKDTTLDRSMKVRILIYAILIPVLLSVLWIVYEFEAAEKAITAAGGGY